MYIYLGEKSVWGVAAVRAVEDKNFSTMQIEFLSPPALDQMSPMSLKPAGKQRKKGTNQ